MMELVCCWRTSPSFQMFLSLTSSLEEVKLCAVSMETDSCELMSDQSNLPAAAGGRFGADRLISFGPRAGGMAKRIADKELTDRNWDQEEEGEEVSPRLD